MCDQSTRTCTGCKTTLPIDCFPLRKDRPGQRYTRCRACQTEAASRWRANSGGHASEYMRQWQAANRERLAEINRRWRSDHREHLAEYDRQRRAANPEAARASSQRWAATNRERMRRSGRASALVYLAIKRGDLTRPDACEACGKTGYRITAAHSDYSRPLDVRWLCSSCHSKWDRAEPKTVTR